MSESVPLPDLFEEAKRLVDGARAQGVTLRLLGGLAARFHCQALLFCLRDYSDIDVMGLGRQRPSIEKIFVALGYEPHRMFNALHGDKRLEFRDPHSERHVDVFLDQSQIYTKAIEDAVHYMSDVLRERADAEGDGVSLVGQALGGDNPRLRINRFQTETEKSEQRGFLQLLSGIYLAIRNPRSHEQYED